MPPPFYFCLVLVCLALPVQAILRWIPVTQSGVKPTTLDSSASVPLAGLNATIFIGGLNNAARKWNNTWDIPAQQVTAVNETWMVQSAMDANGAPTWAWTQGPAFSVAAGGVAAAATADGSQVVRWGGMTPGVATQDSQLAVVHSMSVSGHNMSTWSPMTTTNDPAPVAFAPAFIYEDQFITVGGVNTTGRFAVNTINSLSLTTGAWTTLTPAGITLPGLWAHNAQLLRDFPLRRAVTWLDNLPEPPETGDVILIFGGMLYDAGGICLYENYGAGPSCYLEIPGFAYDLKGNVVYKLNTQGTSFPQRMQAASQITQMNGETVVSISGGLYADSTYVYWFWSDTYFYSLNTLTWRQAAIANDHSIPNRMLAISVTPYFSYGYGSSFPALSYCDAWMLVDYTGAARQSLLTPPSDPPLADGSQTTYLLTLRDYRGVGLDYGGEIVSGFMLDDVGRATIGAVADNKNGTYSILFALSRAGTYRLLVTYNGDSIFESGSQTLVVQPGAPNTETSMVIISPAYRGFNTTVLVKVLDVSGNAVGEADAMAAVAVIVSGAGLRRRDLVDKVWADGYVVCTFVPMTLGTLSISVTLNGNSIGVSAWDVAVTNAVSVPSNLRIQSSGLPLLLIIAACISAILLVISSAAMLRSGSKVTSSSELRWLLALTAPTVLFGCLYTLVVLLPASPATCTLQTWAATLCLIAPSVALLAKGWTLRVQWEEPSVKMRNVDVPACRLWLLNGLCHGFGLVSLVIWTASRTLSSLEAPLTRGVCELDTFSVSYPISVLLAICLGMICVIAALSAMQGERVRRHIPTSNSTTRFPAFEKRKRNPSREAYLVAVSSILTAAIVVIVLGVTLTPTPGNTVAIQYETRAILSVGLCLALSIVLQIALTAPVALKSAKAASHDREGASGGGGFAPNKELATAYWIETDDTTVTSRDLFEMQMEVEMMRQRSGAKEEPWRGAVVTAFVAAKGPMQYIRGRHFVLIREKEDPTAAFPLYAVTAPRLIYLKSRGQSSFVRVDEEAPAISPVLTPSPVAPLPILTFRTLDGDRIRLRFLDITAAWRWLNVMRSMETTEEKAQNAGSGGAKDMQPGTLGKKETETTAGAPQGTAFKLRSGIMEDDE
ncbi:hypothetical protein HDU90_004077 [Geranomyces variabilis]|nr:hypothetical protein HDU90_004077 [Geranomyces variabilis]